MYNPTDVPVMALAPTAGDVDIVIASEIMEAGRMLQRGFITPDRTSVIASTHRVYAINEKTAIGDGTGDDQAVRKVVDSNAKHSCMFDMQQLAREFDSVINAALFGALAGSGALPFPREAFEESIRVGKIAVESNLKTFAAAFDRANKTQGDSVEQYIPIKSTEGLSESFVLPQATTEEGEKLLVRVREFPSQVHHILYLGVIKLVDYQDYSYAHLYLDRVQTVFYIDKTRAGGEDYKFLLTADLARFLALWMSFEDIARIAQLKIRKERFNRFRNEVKAEADQLMYVTEFLRPQIDEICCYLPPALARKVIHSKVWQKFFGLFTGGKKITTNSIVGFLMFYLMAKLKSRRLGSYGYEQENRGITSWLQQVNKAIVIDYEMALELARCGCLIKGYGQTRRRGFANLNKILTAVSSFADDRPGLLVSELRDAAIKDDTSEALDARLALIGGR
jgi:indolepyruvate ferredoxin oxidoreductase beta subunit